MNTANSRHVAIDPATGCVIREATQEEITAYLSQSVRHPSFRRMVRVEAVLVDEDTGPGQWFGGAGF